LNPDKKKGGYLKQRGYQPETFADIAEKPTSIDKTSKTKPVPYPSSKQPRPEQKRLEELQAEEQEQIDQMKKRERERERTEIKELIQKNPKLRKAYQFRNTIIILGIMILIFSLIISYQNYLNMQLNDDSLEIRGYGILQNLQESEALSTDLDLGTESWEISRFLSTNSTQIIDGFDDSFKDSDFIIEVFDLSDYPIKYNRTIVNGKAWSNNDIESKQVTIPDNNFKISTLINIYVSPQEVHLARVTVTVWN
jgi:hypothetical protein